MPPTGPAKGPVVLCAGTDPAAAARLAEATTSLLSDRAVVVLATWDPPPLAGLDSLVDAIHDAHEDMRAAARHAAAEVAHVASEILDAHGVHVTRQVCPEARSPWQVILDLADEVDAAVIVAGTSERTREHGALGSQARALAHRTRRPLLLLGFDAPAAGAAPALFAYDGSAAAARAIRAAAELLRPRHAIVASVWQTASALAGAALLAVPDEVARKGIASLDAAARQRAEGQASEGAARLADAGWACEIVAPETARNVHTAIVEAAAEHDAAIIVTGTRGRSRVAAAVLGSAAEAIVRNAGRPVLLVPPPPS
jgi:nucleotide-binding universal stress UspA family protein